jgi:hypothetical protein
MITNGMGRINRAGIKAAGLTLGLLALAVAGEASASCGALDQSVAGHFKPALFRSDRQGFGFRSVNLDESWPGSIIGLWKIEFLAKGNTNGIPDGALIDFGTASWNGDVTETMVSGGRAPSTGDVCMGAWEQVGRYTYKLNHLAMAWEGGAYAGPTKIQELVTLDPSGNTFRGSFTITAYVASAVAGQEFDESVIAPPTPIHGVITGVRITAD